MFFCENCIVCISQVHGQQGSAGLICDETRTLIDLHQVSRLRDAAFRENQKGRPAIDLFYYSLERIRIQRVDLHGIPVLHEGLKQ